MKGLRKHFEESLEESMPALKDYERRKSVANLFLRWYGTLTPSEKWKIARDLGGNRYAVSTLSILDEFMSMLMEEVD